MSTAKEMEKAYQKYAWILLVPAQVLTFCALGFFISYAFSLFGAIDLNSISGTAADSLFAVIAPLNFMTGVSIFYFWFAQMGLCVLGIFLAAFPLRKGKRWSWFVLWYSPIFYGFLLFSFLQVQLQSLSYVPVFVTFPLLGGFVVGLYFLLSILGLLLPFRKFFPKRKTT